MKLMQVTIMELNNAFIRLTGYPSILHVCGGREYQWAQWLACSDPPWTVQDLEVVVSYVRRHMGQDRKEGRGYKPESLSFANLIGNPSKFMDLLGIAKAEARIKPTTPRQEMLKANGRPVLEPDTVKTPAQVMSESLKMASMLKAWKEQNL